MPVPKALSDTGQFLRDAAPKFRENPSPPTMRDLSTAGLAGAITVVAVTLLHDIAKVELTPEVVAALTTIIGFLMARFFRY